MPRRISKRAGWWVRMPDEALLDLRFCDLGLALERSPVVSSLQRLQQELAHRGISFRPHCWLGEEWFTPDGVPGFAIPFFLAHPRLGRLERRMMGELDGGSRAGLIRILRHEAGHAIDNAYRLRRRSRWRATFGPASQPYSHSYRARPASRAYVQHIDNWYAQSHPTEDFAETFAVWLAPASRWRSEYADWPALAKLECVDALMAEVRDLPAPVRTRLHIEPLVHNTRTLREHYRVALKHARPATRPADDAVLHDAFPSPAGAYTVAAGTALRRLGPALLREVAVRAGCSEYVTRQVLRVAIARATDLALRAPAAERAMRRQVRRLLVELTHAFVRSAARQMVL